MSAPDAPVQEWWPVRGRTVTLAWADGERPVRVVVEDGAVVRCAVDDDGPLPAAGADVELRWTDDRGLWRRPATAGTATPLLPLTAAGPPVREQRRRFTRAPIDVDVLLTDGVRVARGRTRDLSEGGARVDVLGPLPGPPGSLTAHLRVDDADIALPSTVLRTSTGGVEGQVGVEFTTIDEPTAGAIRREVFEAQLQSRRRGPRP